MSVYFPPRPFCDKVPGTFRPCRVGEFPVTRKHLKRLFVLAGLFLALALALITSFTSNTVQAAHNPVACMAPIIVSN